MYLKLRSCLLCERLVGKCDSMLVGNVNDSPLEQIEPIPARGRQ